MAFKEIDQMLIDECSKDVIDVEKIQSLLDDGADVNAFDIEYYESLYGAVLEYYIDEGRRRRPDLMNFFVTTELFLKHNLVLNPNLDNADYFIPSWFRFLPPEQLCVDAFRLLLDNARFSFDDLDNMISDATLDLHLGEYYFFEEHRHYSKEESTRYYLELIYWACAYSVNVYPEKCSKDILEFNWFDRERNKVELIRENRSTSVFVEDLITHTRTEIDGWTMK